MATQYLPLRYRVLSMPLPRLYAKGRTSLRLDAEVLKSLISQGIGPVQCVGRKSKEAGEGCADDIIRAMAVFGGSAKHAQIATRLMSI